MYKLLSFAGVALPVARPKFEAGTAPSQQRLVATVGGGVYDAAGTARARIKTPYELSYGCVARESTASRLKGVLDGLRALRGRESTLYRQALASATYHWATARLMEVEYSTEPQHGFGLFQPLTMRWLVKSPWNGAGHAGTEEAEESLPIDADADTLSVTNGGNAAAENVVLTVDPYVGTVTYFRIRTGACDLIYNGTITTSKLVIDCSPSKMSVLHGGAPAWQYLTIGPTHASDAWLRLEPGANTLTVDMTGGGLGRSLSVKFYDTWE